MTAQPHETTPLTVVLIDDCELATAGLKSILSSFDERITLVDAREALAHPADLDVILYEPMGMSALAGSLLRDLQRASSARSAVFSWAEQDEMTVASARPHLGKRLAASQLVRALEDLVEGRWTASVVPTTAAAPAPVEAPVAPRAAAPRDTPLTPREGDVIALVVSGRSNLEISEQLSVSINSVKTYIRTAYRKMGVTRRSQAVMWGITNGYDLEPAAGSTAATA